MGVGQSSPYGDVEELLSQYLLHQVWVSDKLTFGFGRPNKVSIPSSSGMGVGRIEA